ncbi:MAG: hypothetical protein ACO3B3_03175 [Cyanobium sp.]
MTPPAPASPASDPTAPATQPLGGETSAPLPAALAYWIRTPCGRAKYARLAADRGPAAQLRLGWFVLIAALRDLGQPLPERGEEQWNR